MAVKSERHRPLQKVLEMVKYLAAHRFGVNTGDLAREMDMSRENVFRYLRAMDEAGIGIERSRRPDSPQTVVRLTDRTARCMFGGALSGPKPRRSR